MNSGYIDMIALKPGKRLILVCLLLGFGFVACNPSSGQNPSNEVRVVVVDGGVSSAYVYEDPIPIEEFLRRIDAEVDSLDRVDPPRFMQIQDGMTITIVRVEEQSSCYEEELPYETQRTPINILEPGEEEIGQAGVPGRVEVCERCLLENGQSTSCSVTSRNVIENPVSEIIFYGIENADVPVTVEGKLAYISNGQAWLIEGNAINRRALTTDGRLDGRVFELSRNGEQLLFTRYTASTSDLEFSNELWAVLDTSDTTVQPVRLGLNNVLQAQWMPNEPFTISYSTAEPTANLRSGYEAYNDVWKMRIDRRSGDTLDLDPVVNPNALTSFAYWGTNFEWSPDGTQLAWSSADGVGLVDFETGNLIPLLSFPYFGQAITAGWVWQPDLHWSQDGQMLITSAHGPPVSNESDIDSAVFDIAVLSPARGLTLDALISRAGMWAQPRYSPVRQDNLNYPDYQIAYLQAQEPLNSLGGFHQLVVADRDGSNPRVIFPPEGRPGLRPFHEPATEFIWSPSGNQLAVIYQGNLWIVDIGTGVAQAITTDGQASHPRWTG